MRSLALLVLAWLPCAAIGADFRLSAEVSKKRLELGEAFILSLTLDIDGNFTFAPQLEMPPLDGFQAQGSPRQSQNVQWINGTIKAQVIVQWELVPLKSGRLKLGPFKATAKDAATGEVQRSAPEIWVEVAKPAGPLIPPTPEVEPESGELEAERLRDLKPDLGFPWARALLLAVAGLLLLAGLAWLALRPSKPRKIEAVRDPGQVALHDLEKARALLLAGDAPGYLRELSRILRFYLRHRLRIPEKEITLLQAQDLLERALKRDLPEAGRLGELLFGGRDPEARDLEEIPRALRQAIVELERESRWGPRELFLASLEQAADARAMKQALEAHLRLLEERDGVPAVRERLERGLEELGPAARGRVEALLLSKPRREEPDLERLRKDLERLAPLLEDAKHGE